MTISSLVIHLLFPYRCLLASQLSQSTDPSAFAPLEIIKWCLKSFILQLYTLYNVADDVSWTAYNHPFSSTSHIPPSKLEQNPPSWRNISGSVTSDSSCIHLRCTSSLMLYNGFGGPESINDHFSLFSLSLSSVFENFFDLAN